jgi:hypothetical protein
MAATVALTAVHRASRGPPEQVRYPSQVRAARQRIREYEHLQWQRLHAVS